MPHKRRPRYSGKNPRRFTEKYKEHDPAKFPETVQAILAAGKTPAGAHRPIMVQEILDVLRPMPGEFAVDCTLGYGGHARELLHRLQLGGSLIGLDADPIELPRTEKRFRDEGFAPDAFRAHRCNFAGLPKVLALEGGRRADLILADLGVSSMQLDNPARGFSLKFDGPLDMRMNPNKGQSAAILIQRTNVTSLAELFSENADELYAEQLALALAGTHCQTTLQLVERIRRALPHLSDTEKELSVRRIFQALRIAVNEEFVAIDTLLRALPECLAEGGRVAILTFHSGEDRRVKKAFKAGLLSGVYASAAEEVLRPSAEEMRANSRSKAAKLRWAVRSMGQAFGRLHCAESLQTAEHNVF